MENTEFFNYREFLLDESKDEHGFISDSAFLNSCLPSLNETKLIDSEECNECFCSIDNDQLKIDGYLINESSERLQVFILNEETLDLNKNIAVLSVSQKSYYDKHFNRAVNFIKKSIKKQLDEAVQDSSPAKPLISFLGSSAGIEQIDVIEVFLISATLTIETRGESPQPKRIDFEDDDIKVSYTKERSRIEKEITLIKRLIDLNFLYNVVISQGNREALVIDFSGSSFDYKINCIEAANEQNFESFLCVLPATLLAELYKRYSSRMLEKNVRSFLQLKGVNKGMQETIKKTPEKFIAYNNGLTITATGKELLNENGNLYLKTLTDFQIVNGGQTTATIYFSKKNGLDISNVRVMAKINVAKNATEEELDDLITNISTYSNAQSKVSKVDLKSRSIQLVKLKSLSESILTPSSKKWFFERAKGEYNTLIRKNPNQKNRINRDYPKERRFTKEELAKYYTSWGVTPYLVKKGGEKVFRYFIENITGENKSSQSIEIDRLFYENLIAKIILFKTLEKLHGVGPSAIGQIRSAVVPYTISILYKYTNENKNGNFFDLQKIWKSESLEEDLQVFSKSLMLLMNDLVKKYSESDDYGEYSKKEELWNAISECDEIKNFMNQSDFQKISDKYTISKEAIKKREIKKTNAGTIDFEPLHDMITIYSNTELFYKNINSFFFDTLKENEKYKIQQIINLITNHQDINPSYITFEKKLINEIRRNKPEFFDLNSDNKDFSLSKTLDYIIKKYNSVIESNLNIKSEFYVLSEIAQRKGVKYYSVFEEIGKLLEQGLSPSIKQLYNAGNYVSIIKEV